VRIGGKKGRDGADVYRNDGEVYRNDGKGCLAAQGCHCEQSAAIHAAKKPWIATAFGLAMTRGGGLAMTRGGGLAMTQWCCFAMTTACIVNSAKINKHRFLAISQGAPVCAMV